MRSLVLKLCGNQRSVINTLRNSLKCLVVTVLGRGYCVWIGFTRMVGGVIVIDRVLCRRWSFSCLLVLNCVKIT